MRFYKHAHAFYAGVDLHARSMFTHILDHDGNTVFEADLPARAVYELSRCAAIADHDNAVASWDHESA